MTFYKWSKTAASNGTADSTCPWPEGMAPSQVNDSARGNMAASAKFRDDISGALTTGGSSTAYTISSNQAFDTLAHMDGALIAFTPHTTSGATVTINVDALGAKPLRVAPSVELPTGALVQGTPYVATYFNSSSEWILHGLAGNPYSIPLGGFLPYVGTTAPNSAFVLPYGQAISRTTYSTLFSLISTTFGSGDGSTTFNIPDLRGRVVAGKDDMGGSSANRLTGLSGGVNGDTLGATGGAESHALTEAQNGPHDHGGLTGTVSHTHDLEAALVDGATGGNIGQVVYRTGSTDFTAIEAEAAHQHPITSSGSGTAHNNVQPTIILPYIMRVI